MQLNSLAISALLLAGLVAGSQAANQVAGTAGDSKTIRVANAAVASAYVNEDQFPSLRHERMANFSFMIGIWDLSSKEMSHDGGLLEASGTRSCVWVLDRTAIRCDDSVDMVRAKEGYPGLHRNHDQLFYLTFNQAANRYEYTYMSPTSADKQIFYADFDQANRVLTRFIPLENGNNVMPVRLWQVSDDEIRESAPAGQEQRDKIETVLSRKVPAASLTRF